MSTKRRLNYEAIRTDKRNGMSNAEIAEKHNASVSSIENIVGGLGGFLSDSLDSPDGMCRHRGCNEIAGDVGLCNHHRSKRFFPLDFLTEAKRFDYDHLCKSGLSRSEAMARLGRHDLMTAEVS